VAQQPASKKESQLRTQLALGGVVVALLVLLLAAVARTPLHPPFYDTISSGSSEQVGEP
jgi:hypothetical protein